MGWLRRGVVATATASSIIQRVGERQDRVRYPPPGHLVDIGGRSIHLVDYGGDGPVVVVETGSGALALGWSAIVPAISPVARVITYDRAGYGWSDADGWRRTGDDVARDLSVVLTAIDAAPPFVLVGHSLGGLYARSFVGLFPEDVGGLVLVDSSHEDMLNRLRATLGPGPVIAQAAASLLLAAAPRGLARVVTASGALNGRLRGVVGGDTDAQVRLHLSLYLRSDFRRALIAESLGMIETMRSLRAGRRALTIPIAIVTAADPRPDDTSFLARLRPVWVELQRDLASLSSDVVHVTAQAGGHFVHHDDPDVVVAAIKGVVARVAPTLA